VEGSTVNREAKNKKILGICDRALGVRRKLQKAPPLETAVHALLAPGNRDDQAAAALKELLLEFVDWNEVRVSSWKEIGSVLENAGLADPGDKAILLRKLLEAVFNRFNKMSLDPLLVQKPEDARRTLEAMADVPDPAAGAVLNLNLGFDGLHATHGLTRVARRVGFLRDGPAAQLKKDLESNVPRKDRFRFQQHLGHIGRQFCLAGVTLCARCPLHEFCSTGVQFLKAAREVPDAPRPRAPRPDAPKGRPAAPAPKAPGGASAPSAPKGAPAKPAPRTAPPAKKPPSAK
jgi:endonuclease III